MLILSHTVKWKLLIVVDTLQGLMQQIIIPLSTSTVTKEHSVTYLLLLFLVWRWRSSFRVQIIYPKSHGWSMVKTQCKLWKSNYTASICKHCGVHGLLWKIIVRGPASTLPCPLFLEFPFCKMRGQPS